MVIQVLFLSRYIAEKSCLNLIEMPLKFLELNTHLNALEIPSLSDDCVKKIEEAVPTVPSWWLPA